MVRGSYITGQVIHMVVTSRQTSGCSKHVICYRKKKVINTDHVAHLATYQSLLWGTWATWLKCLLLSATGEQAFSWSPSAPAGLKVAWQSCFAGSPNPSMINSGRQDGAAVNPDL